MTNQQLLGEIDKIDEEIKKLETNKKRYRREIFELDNPRLYERLVEEASSFSPFKFWTLDEGWRYDDGPYYKFVSLDSRNDDISQWLSDKWDDGEVFELIFGYTVNVTWYGKRFYTEGNK